MKNTFVLIALAAASMVFVGACNKAEANSSAGTNNVAALKNPEPTPAKKGKTQKEIDIKNGSVKADDYEENSGLGKEPGNSCDIYAYVIDKDPAGLNIRDSDEDR
jgi:hypothetical protein